MADGVVPVAPPTRVRRLATELTVLGLRASMIFSPRPTTLALRSVFEKSAAQLGAQQLRDAPADIVAVLDERYDPSPDALLDV